MYRVFRNLTPAQRRVAYDYFTALPRRITRGNSDVWRDAPYLDTWGYPYSCCPLGACNVTLASVADDEWVSDRLLPCDRESLDPAFGDVDEEEFREFLRDNDNGRIKDLAAAMGVEDGDAGPHPE